MVTIFHDFKYYLDTLLSIILIGKNVNLIGCYKYVFSCYFYQNMYSSTWFNQSSGNVRLKKYNELIKVIDDLHIFTTDDIHIYKDISCIAHACLYRLNGYTYVCNKCITTGPYNLCIKQYFNGNSCANKQGYMVEPL